MYFITCGQDLAMILKKNKDKEKKEKQNVNWMWNQVFLINESLYIHNTWDLLFIYSNLKRPMRQSVFCGCFFVWSKNMEISWIRSWQQVAVLVQDKSLSQKDEGVCLYETETDWKGDY